MGLGIVRISVLRSAGGMGFRGLVRLMHSPKLARRKGVSLGVGVDP